MMNIFWLCLRSLWSSRRKEEDEQMIWRVLEVEVEFQKERGRWRGDFGLVGCRGAVQGGGGG